MGVNFWIKVKKYWLKTILFLVVVYFSNLFDNIFDPFNKYIMESLKGIYLVVYNWVILIIAFKIPAYSLIIGVLAVWLGNNVYRTLRTRHRKFKVIKAVYGKGNKFIDITNNLNDKVEDDKLKIVLDNSIAGDPVVGTRKEGVVKYRYNGKKEERRYNEREVIELP